ncbi:MAG: hypothetical protein EPN57_04505 [Paraburkholderia sp.]|nr:MAG: hypothetical protein EPN57_04505 [Paraburkholderia sp.]
MAAVSGRLYEEIAFIAYHLHWSRADILSMAHSERRRWCEEISKINDKINAAEDSNQPRGIDIRALG